MLHTLGSVHTSSNGTNAKGARPLWCDIREITVSCNSTGPRMPSPGSIIPSLFTLLVESESKSILLLAPKVVPLNLQQSNKQNGIK
jgi:hypothetical protein